MCMKIKGTQGGAWFGARGRMHLIEKFLVQFVSTPTSGFVFVSSRFVAKMPNPHTSSYPQ